MATEDHGYAQLCLVDQTNTDPGIPRTITCNIPIMGTMRLGLSPIPSLCPDLAPSPSHPARKRTCACQGTKIWWWA